ncbi:MAG TPA: FAD-binding protein, partial [Pirellulaceae bacterium]|nr:FAD-binding protein [Pirellulaceae bacterium]
LALQQKGAKLLANAAVECLLREGDRVVGVQALVDGVTREYHATRGVILAAGDYANNREMIAEHKGEQYRAIEGINPFATGDGHRLAKDAGAQLVNMDVTYGPELRFVPSSKRPFQQWLPASGLAARFMGAVATRLPSWMMRSMIKRLLVTWQHPENALFDDGAILLNRDGQRFVDETKYPDREIALASQPDKIAYILLDRRLIERYSAWPHFISTAPDIAYAYVADYLRLRPDVARRGTSLDQVADRAGLDPVAVRSSVHTYSASLSEHDAKKLPLEGGPWVLLGPVKAYFTTTEGGAVVNDQMQVVGEDGTIVPGLYAVGQNGLSGMILWSHGLHIAWAMTSGRLAGIACMATQDR